MNWSWLEVAAMICIGLGLTLGVAGAVYLYIIRPQFWWDMIIFLGGKFGPAILAALVKVFARMPPEEEAEWRKAVARGDEREWMRERQRRKAKEYWERKKNGR